MADGRGGRSLCLVQPRVQQVLQLSLEVEHREAGNTTGGEELPALLAL